MTLPKFIITMDGYFRLGMVNQHKHLLETLKVPSTYRGMRIVYSYDDGITIKHATARSQSTKGIRSFTPPLIFPCK